MYHNIVCHRRGMEQGGNLKGVKRVKRHACLPRKNHSLRKHTSQTSETSRPPVFVPLFSLAYNN